MRLPEGANVKLIRILLPITEHGTTEACAASAFNLAERSGAQLEVLHACPAPAERTCPNWDGGEGTPRRGGACPCSAISCREATPRTDWQCYRRVSAFTGD